MRAVLVVVANILREQAFQVAFVNCDDVIQEFTAATPYPTLCDSILPTTFERGTDRTHRQGSNRCGDFQSILGITIKDDEPWSGSKWKCFSQLLDDPQACRMLRDVEVQDAPAIMTDNEKAIEQAEGDRRNSEEIHRGNRFPVITKFLRTSSGNRSGVTLCSYRPSRHPIRKCALNRYLLAFGAAHIFTMASRISLILNNDLISVLIRLQLDDFLFWIKTGPSIAIDGHRFHASLRGMR
jgi:hypothetical protein